MPDTSPEAVKISRKHDLNTEAGLIKALQEMGKIHESVLYMVINQARTVFPVYGIAAVGIVGALLGAWIGAHLN